MDKHIPTFFYKFFQWLCKSELFEELQGDLEEDFEENQKLHGTAKARSIYRIEVIKMIRPSVLKYWRLPRSFNHFIMFQNYFKTSFRSMIKNPLTSFINVFGLAVAIGMCLVVYAFFTFDKSLDQFHENKHSVYLTTYFVDREGAEQQYGTTPIPLGEMLRNDFTNIQKVCRVKDLSAVLKYGDKVFHERIRYADPEFLEMLTFPMQWGLSTTLSDINSIILSEEMSIKYFGHENPIGESVLVVFDENNSKTFTVSGVAQAFPKARTIDFDFLINFDNFKISNPDYNQKDWSNSVHATLIQVNDKADLNVIMDGMNKYKELQNEVQSDWAINSFFFEPLAGLHFKSDSIRNDISFDGNKEARQGMPIMALFMLVLACFNYINIAIVSAAKRLKEIALRKVIGANRRLVIVQFLTENVFVTSFALLVGLILSMTLFMPWLSQLSGWHLTVSLIDINLWVFLLGMLLVTGVASGMYPAFYISRFEVVKIFKGSVQFGKKNTLTKVFLGLQLIMTCAGITCAVVFKQNNTFQNNQSWGYNQKDALYVEIPDKSAFEKISAKMLQNPKVLSISGSSHHLGKNHSMTILHLPDREYEVEQLSVDANYFETLGIQLKQGRFFKDNLRSDNQSVVVNEMVVKNLGWKQPIGQVFKIDTTLYEVVGVSNDFHSYSFERTIRPTIFLVADDMDYRYLSLKSKSGFESEVNSALQKEWSLLFPEIPFQGGHQQDVWNGYFNMLDIAEEFYRVLASIAVILASLGLYGLVRLNVTGRVKEFSIRKALGAGIKNLAAIIVNQYAVLCAIALIIGIPFSYWLAESALNLIYAYPMPMGYSGILLSMGILVFVLLGVISTQVRKVVKSNPVDGLNAEG